MQKRVGVVCATYRDPGKDSLVRLYGVVSLLDQMRRQKGGHDIKLALVDDSPEPHPFYEEIAEAFADSVIYIHAPDRNSLSAILRHEYPQSSIFVPTDEILQKASRLELAARLKNGETVFKPDYRLACGEFDLNKDEWDYVIDRKPAPGSLVIGKLSSAFLENALSSGDDENVAFWAKRIAQVRTFAKYLPFESDYPVQTNIFSQIFQVRPTIGMKKNVGVAAIADRFGEFDAIVFADDDDHHGPDYVARSIEALGEGHFTRMTRYLTYILHNDETRQIPGIFELKIKKDFNGYWDLPSLEEKRKMHCWHPEGYVYDHIIGKKFSRPVNIAWPILSHEGALHTYSFAAWKKAVSIFGGAVPVSFCEDLLFYRMMKDSFGCEFDDRITEIKPGEESFIRMADGRNESVIEWMETIRLEDFPQWGKEAMSILNAAKKMDPKSHRHALQLMARKYITEGCLDSNLLLIDRPKTLIDSPQPVPD